MNELVVSITIPLHAARICRESIRMEAESEGLPRSKVDLSCIDDTLRFHIAAADLSAMRAAMNTYLRWINMCISLVGKENKIKNGSTDV